MQHIVWDRAFGQVVDAAPSDSTGAGELPAGEQELGGRLHIGPAPPGCRLLRATQISSGHRSFSPHASEDGARNRRRVLAPVPTPVQVMAAPKREQWPVGER